MKNFVLFISIFILLPIIAICLSLPIYSDSTNNFIHQQTQHLNDKGKIELVSASSHGVTLKLSITKSDFKIKTLKHDDKEYQTISFPGCRFPTEPGTHRLPIQTGMIGVPPDTSFTVRIIDRSDFSTIKLQYPLANHYIFYRKNNIGVDKLNKTSNNLVIDSANRYLPTDLAKIGNVGWIRENRVLPIQINPVQYNPSTSVVKLYHNLVIEVQFNNLGGAPSAIQGLPLTESAVYEEMFDNLLVNPQAAKQWRSPNNRSILHLDSRIDSELGDQNPQFSIPRAPSLAYQPNYKILITESGMHRVTGSDLAAAGADITTINPTTLTMTNKGKQIPIYVRNTENGTSETDSSNTFKGLDPNTEIIFYAQRHRGEKTYFDPYTEFNVYWLTWNAGPGLRMETQTLSDDIPLLSDGTVALSQPRSFFTRAHFEKDLQFRRFENFGLAQGDNYDEFGEGIQDRHFTINALPDLPDDSWFWAQMSAPQTRAFAFDINGIAGTGQKATLRVVLHGRSENAHFTELWLNNNIVIDRPRWSGDIEHRTENQQISQSELKEGRNTLNVVSPGENSIDLIMMNWFEIDYWRNYDAIDNVLPFSVTLLPDDLTGIVYPDFKIKLKNFTNPNIEIYGVDGTRYVGLAPIEDKDTPGIYTLDFQSKQISGIQQTQPNEQLQLNTDIQYIALSNDKYLKPEAIIEDTPSELRGNHNGADYIIITYTEFVRDVQPLANFRRQQGLRASVVDVQDIYDEFNHGISNPYAVKEFLRYAYENWQAPAPTYVLLFGDTNPKDKTSFVPTIQIQVPGHGSSASDHQFVTIRGNDNFPDMLVGRVPVTNSVDARIFVERAINYENINKRGPWHKRILMLAGSDEIFHHQTDSLIEESHLIDKYETKRIYAPATAEEELTLGEGITPVGRQVIDGFNGGASLVNYVGHGGGGRWASSRMMDLEDPHKNLTNISQLPFVISMTCFTGQFDNRSSCLAEEFLRSENGGAIAVIGGTSIGLLIQDHILNKEIFEVIFNDNTQHLGAIMAEAKTQFLLNAPGYLDIAEVFTLFGDPATQLKLPHKQMHINANTENITDKNGFTTDTLVTVSGMLHNTDFHGDAEITILPNSLEKSIKKKRTERRPPDTALPRSIDNAQRIETIPVVDGKFKTQMQIPFNNAFDAFNIRVYAWNNDEDAIGYLNYTPIERYIKNVRLEPFPIVADQPVHIYVDVVDESAIAELTVYWSEYIIDNRRDEATPIPMVKARGTTYRTENPIPAFGSSTQIDYYILVKPKNDRIQHTEIVTYEVGIADLIVLEHTINWGPDTSFLLSAQIKNIGSLNAKNVPVSFYQIPVTDNSETQNVTLELLENATQIGNVQKLDEVPPDEFALVTVPWRPNPGKYRVVVYVDVPSAELPNGTLPEGSDSNNDASQIIDSNHVFLTADNLNKPLQSSDGLLRISIPSESINTHTFVSFETKAVTITNQPDITHQVSDVEQTEHVAYHLNFSQQNELTVTATFVKNSEENMHIYVQDDQTGNWIRVSNQTKTDEEITANVKLPGTFALLTHTDSRPPTLEITVENQGFIDGDYISDIPTISAKIEDANGVDPHPENIILTQNGVRVAQDAYTVAPSPLNKNVLLITYNPIHALQPGEYRIRLQAQDANGNIEDTELTARVAGGFEIKNIANFPNPFRPGNGSGKGTVFAYYLTESAETVSLKIYTLTGKLITTVDTLDADTSYNEYRFNGLDEDGEPLANGVYIYKFNAKKGDKRAQKVGKIVVIK